MLEDYLKLLSDFLKNLGQNLDSAQTENLKILIANALAEGFKNSPHANLIVSYFPANSQAGLAGGITLNTKIQIESMAQKYHSWPDIRPEPLFGSHPDAKVIAIAAELGEPGKAPILDVGAGPGRNSLPLARLGHSVDAIELTPIFAEKLSSLCRLTSAVAGDAKKASKARAASAFADDVASAAQNVVVI